MKQFGQPRTGQCDSPLGQIASRFLVLGGECIWPVAGSDRERVDSLLRLLKPFGDPILFVHFRHKRRWGFWKFARTLDHRFQIILRAEQIVPEKM